MAIRLAVLGLSHETNTFSTEPYTLAEHGTGLRGGEILAAHEGTPSTYGGFVTDPGELEIVPLVAAGTTPCGPLSRADLDAQLDLMAQLLTEQGPFDGVLLSVHGAFVAEEVHDADAAVAARVRQAVGPDVLVGAVIDMHANVDHGMVEQLDLVFPYQTNPHVDASLRGRECRDTMVEMISGGWRAGVALEQLPLVVTITKQDTDTEPMAGLLTRSRELEAEDGVLDVSILEGFPYADVPFLGMSVLVTHRDGTEAAAGVARRMAAEVWEAREALQGTGLPVPEAVRTAVASERQPVLVLDVGDNVGGGGPADSTVLLQELISQRVERSLAIIFDPDAVAELADAAIGDRVEVTAGARRPESAGEPALLRGTLVGRGDGRYAEPKMSHGGIRDFDAGEQVAILLDEGPTVVLNSVRVQPISAYQLVNVGLDPASFALIAAKGVNGPRAGYRDVCREFIEADTAGITRSSVTGFDYTHRRRPMFPYEPETTYPVTRSAG